MHTLYLRIGEDIEFPKMLNVKKSLGKPVESINTISPELKLRQGVFYCVLQSLRYNIGGMHTLTPKTREDMVFQR
jgi:hypothetical protein